MKKNIFLFFFIIAVQLAYAQVRDESTALYKFMQVNADSTIIVQYTGGWIDPPNLYLLSKKGDTLTCYMYKDVRKYSSINKVPRRIAATISSRLMMEIYKTPIDVNQFFNVFDIKPDTLIKFWREVSALKPWDIKDDSVDGGGCPLNKNVNSISIEDGLGIWVHLITKNNIKSLVFYEPDSFEKYCPGRKGRQSIIKFTKLFHSYFK
ncbi:hypothetical protein EZ449_11750 [Pedobacter frigidisoli]|uniref:Uncharacterized protein n=1 Tax=Pedobacter frigidisoli TaxID=2530455 RepID=A0A4R0P022_9SPHI|nr:hypothetical protein [Pedobacter frigidisoli]TCD08511.1 hypothetical protein EZ449_11750 [Pedobacter frigidisoli]